MKAATFAVVLILYFVWSGHALILLNKSNSDTGITSDPLTGVPWKNVAQLMNGSTPGGSGVYLGNQYLLTANHVSSNPTVIIDGQSFTVDTTFNSGGFTNGARQIGTADLKMLRLASDPALVVSGLVDVNLNTSTTLDLSQSVTLIGYGQGRGTEVTGQGWNWAAGTEVQRWGTNTTLDTIYSDGSTLALATEFNSTGPDTEAALTMNDSGSGLFFQDAGDWYLAGIGFTVDVLNSSFYERDLVTPGEQPDKSYFVRISSYHSEISSALSVIPEPSTATLLGVSGFLLLLRRRRNRSTGDAVHPGVMK